MALVAREEPEPKRQRLDVVPAGPGYDGVVAVPANQRKSGILAPTMLLTGHQGEVFSCEFSPDGRNLASGSFDKQIYLWQTYEECPNWCVLKGHTNAVLEIHWKHDGTQIYSCSADKSVCVWDVEEGQRTKKFNGHQAVVNSCSPNRRGPPLLCSGADDGTTKVWDLRTRRSVNSYEHQYQILAVTFDDSAERVFAGSLDNTIRVFDMRRGEEDTEMTLKGHADSITGIDLSKDGRYLLSNSMDNTVRQWNVEPFFTSRREITAFTGPLHNFEKNLLRVRWNAADTMCGVGSSDRFVYVFDTKERKLLYKLPGHTGSVNEVCFHPTEPVIASASNDKRIYMGELA
ncbi:unnamed protein product [Vitrella brassicaformis CCMP3155]|uniref:Uncharacterized protein n=2 Tax=Vitrella brassicaformis TaxID=1169539 RepID=A0A0G4H5X0_VITBC|nr:unnamed protein product [Vitrella brassicaformis CCMP3155]|mmetsp:Transcript_33285/g.82432  ORF Transcript_33285/g.82432 Transcript_33285/m.82432 type:complete len:345 (+) Transcript_33285:105-1139(+)|eukprot:CEM38977.1 unnamed protein product [Vitrella brassicaformis CCMP3155]